jgi:hypothetical protein
MQLQVIQKKIYEIRGQKVMLDFDLALLYEVETRVLKQAVRRNIDRFPDDFMFELTNNEFNTLKNSMTSQIVIPYSISTGYTPFAFTEQGVAMLSGVLKSKKAIEVNISIMRAFVFIRQYALTHKDLTEKLKELETKYNRQFADVYEALKYLMDDKQNRDDWEKRKKIGFKK